MIKRVLVLVILCLLLTTVVMADEVEEDNAFQFNPEIFRQGRGIKGNGGPFIGMVQLELSDLNEILVAQGYEKLAEEIIVFGGGGLGGIKNGPRFGGIGVAGTTSTKNTDGDELILDISYGGFLFEQGVFSSPKSDIAIGGLLGGGVFQVHRVESFLGDFGDAIGESHSTSLQKEFVLIQPHVSLHLQVMAFLGLQISVGYLAAYDMGTDWDFFGTNISGPMGLVHGPSATMRLSFGF